MGSQNSYWRRYKINKLLTTKLYKLCFIGKH